jgi:hypothetical protein
MYSDCRQGVALGLGVVRGASSSSPKIKSSLRNVTQCLGLGTIWKTRRTWEDNIRIDLRKIGCEGVDWIHLAKDTDQWSSCEHGNGP